MKNIIFKILFILGISFCFNTYAVVLGPNIKVKLNGADNASYSTQLNNINNSNTALNFEVVGIFMGTSTGKYSISFPNGFLYDSYSNTETTCNNVNVSGVSNTSFVFEAKPTNQMCVVKFILNYRVGATTTGGNQQINIFDMVHFTNTNGLNIAVNNINHIIKAETLDLDKNGYIETYKLTFATGGLLNFSNNGLTVGGFTPTLSGAVNGNIAFLSFDNATYTTGDIPQIIDTDGGIFTGIAPTQANDILEGDSAQGLLKSVNALNVISIPNPNISIGYNEKLTFILTEKVLSNSVYAGMKIKENGVDITNTSYIHFPTSDSDTFYYCFGGYNVNGSCIGNFNPLKIYTIDLSGAMTDIKGNALISKNIALTISGSYDAPPMATGVSYNSQTNSGILIQGNIGNNNYISSATGGVLLSIGAIDDNGVVDKMCLSNTLFSNDNICANGWVNYSNISQYSLPGTPGMKTVYIKFKDGAGNVSEVYADSIIWDNNTPLSSIMPDGGNVQNGNVNITFNCSDSISGCEKIYYTIDGTTPSLSSLNIVSGGTIVLSGSGATKVVKYFAKDMAGNIESPINTRNFIFGNSYITVSNSIGLTAQGNITLTGSCDNALGNSNIEYSINNSAYSDVTTDNCNTTHNWSQNFVLLTNVSNSIHIRFKNNIAINQSVNVINDMLAPSSGSILLENGNATTTTNSINVSLFANDTNGVSQMCLSESPLLNDNACVSGWKNYSNILSYALSSNVGLKTVYVKFMDVVGNISGVIQASITLNIPSSGGGSSSSGGGGGGSWSYISNTITSSGSNVGGITSTGQVLFSSQKIIDEKKAYLSSHIQNDVFKKYIDLLGNPLYITNFDYYLQLNGTFKNQYVGIVNAYGDLLLNIDNFYSSKNTSYLQNAKDAYVVYKTFATFKNIDFEAQYVTKEKVGGILVYKTKNLTYSSALAKIENVVLSKFKNLVTSESITKDSYTQGMSNYNQFILYFSIYKQTGDATALEKALSYAKGFIKIYSLSVK